MLACPSTWPRLPGSGYMRHRDIFTCYSRESIYEVSEFHNGLSIKATSLLRIWNEGFQLCHLSHPQIRLLGVRNSEWHVHHSGLVAGRLKQRLSNSAMSVSHMWRHGKRNLMKYTFNQRKMGAGRLVLVGEDLDRTLSKIQHILNIVPTSPQHAPHPHVLSTRIPRT